MSFFGQGQQAPQYSYNGIASVRVDMGWQAGRANLDAAALVVAGSFDNINDMRALSPNPYESFVNKHNLQLSNSSLRHCGEDRTGHGPSWQPDESIVANLDLLDHKASGVLFFLNIEDGFRLDIEFDEVRDVWCGVTDQNTGRQLNRVDVDRKFKGRRSACIGGVRRTATGWEHSKLSFGSDLELQFLLRGFGLQV